MSVRIDDLAPLLDPELRAPFEALPALDLARVRDWAALRRARAVPALEAPDGLEIETLEAPGLAADGPVRLRVYRPATPAPSRPVLLWIHGGGFVMGDLDGGDPACCAWARAASCTVVSVDYRLAPEHPFPAGPDDCYAALLWVAGAPDALGAPASRIAVGGASAGGCLAAAVALMARDRSGPSLCHQHLVIPVLDDRLETPSSQAIHDPRVWNRSNARIGWRHYLGEAKPTPYAAPARATDLAGLPPATILVEELDVLRDEAVEYANRLTQAGVPTELHVYPGTFHGHHAFVPEAAVSRRTNRDFREALIRSFR